MTAPPWCDSCEVRPAEDEGILCRPCRALAREIAGLADVDTECPDQVPSS